MESIPYYLMFLGGTVVLAVALMIGVGNYLRWQKRRSEAAKSKPQLDRPAPERNLGREKPRPAD
jgi:hypothetical protein